VVILLSAAGMAAFLYSSLFTLAMCISVFVMHRLYLASTKRKWKRSFAWARFRSDLAYPLIVGITLPSIVTGPAWLSKEAVEVAGQQRVVSVIKETGEYLIYLDTTSNKVVRAEPAEVTKRAFCGSNQFDNLASLMQHLGSGPTYPACPKIEH
jgi:hypothetical protein